MATALSHVWPFALMSILFLAICSISDCHNPMDPNGNITVTFNILQWTTNPDGYLARVTIQNYYQYRHVGKAGWSLGWTWAKDEVIWSMRGAFAIDMGNCSSFKSQIPHSCKPNPVIADLMLHQTSPDNVTEGCCRGGTLYPSSIDPSKSFASFEVQVVSKEGTWKSTCTYSSFLTNKTPMCCVSLSTFYNPIVTPCSKCSCGCRNADKSADSCIREGDPSSPSSSVNNVDRVRCTDHMCPVRVHWHVKNNYVDHWRVKLTVSNYNYKKNYTDWNVLIQHPGFKNLVKTYSFNTTLLPAVGLGDEVALFWGLKYYNDELLNAEKDQFGSVSTEILLKKDFDSFTLSNGWALPRRIYFNGESCQMPPPDDFPILPNGSSKQKSCHPFVLVLVILAFKTLL